MVDDPPRKEKQQNAGQARADTGHTAGRRLFIPLGPQGKQSAHQSQSNEDNRAAIDQRKEPVNPHYRNDRMKGNRIRPRLQPVNHTDRRPRQPAQSPEKSFTAARHGIIPDQGKRENRPFHRQRQPQVSGLSLSVAKCPYSRRSGHAGSRLL